MILSKFLARTLNPQYSNAPIATQRAARTTTPIKAYLPRMPTPPNKIKEADIANNNKLIDFASSIPLLRSTPYF